MRASLRRPLTCWFIGFALARVGWAQTLEVAEIEFRVAPPVSFQCPELQATGLKTNQFRIAWDAQERSRKVTLESPLYFATVVELDRQRSLDISHMYPPPGEPPIQLRPRYWWVGLRDFFWLHPWTLVVVGASGFWGIARLRKPQGDLAKDSSSIPGYVLFEKIGSGGMGDVFRGFQADRPEQPLAIKILRLDGDSSAELQERFRREVGALARLQHPGIVKILDWGETKMGEPFLVMEYLEGRTLKTRIEQNRPQPLQVLGWLQQLAAALEHLHQAGLVHRDVKPANLFLTDQDRLVLMDFGTIFQRDRTQLTQTGVVLGTPSFIAPEQLRSQAGPASDQYSVGLVAYRMLTGRPAFEADTVAEILAAQLHDYPPEPHIVEPSLSSSVSRVLMRMLRKEPHLRYPSVSAAVEDLKMAVTGNDEDGTEKFDAPS